MCLLTVLTVTFLSVAGPAASASVAISNFSATPSTTQAGGHPNLTVEFGLTSHQSIPIL